MIVALDTTGERVFAQKGGRATCPCCKHNVIAKAGSIIVPHWAHESVRDCDPWSEGETEWHLGWKAKFPKDRCEIGIGPHRADVQLENGLVIEFQHSPISVEEIEERENFYKNMIWVFDGRAFKDRFFTRALDSQRFLFHWKSPKPSFLSVRTPLFIDFGERLFFVEKLVRGGGFGRFVSITDAVEKHSSSYNSDNTYSLFSFLDCMRATSPKITSRVVVFCSDPKKIPSTVDVFLESRFGASYGYGSGSLSERWQREEGPFSIIFPRITRQAFSSGFICAGRPIIHFEGFSCLADIGWGGLIEGAVVCVTDGDSVFVVRT